MRLKTLLLLPCVGLVLLLAASPAGAVERLHPAASRGGVANRAAAPAPASVSANTLVLAVWTYLTQAGLVPPPPPPPPDAGTEYSTDNSDQGATLDPNGGRH